jgi:hypothetical protein
MTCSLRKWTFPGIISKEVTDTFLFCLILFARYASGILRSYADPFLYMPHAHSYYICSSFTVYASVTTGTPSSQESVMCRFSDLLSSRATSLIAEVSPLLSASPKVTVCYCSQKYFIITLYEVALLAETGLNQLELHTHTHTHCIVRFF